MTDDEKVTVMFWATRSYDVRVAVEVEKAYWDYLLEEFGNNPAHLYDALYENDYEFEEDDISASEEVVTDFDVLYG